MGNSGVKSIFLACLSLIILLIVLYFGLSGKGFSFSNNVTWIKDEPGIRFGTYGIAYALLDNDQTMKSISSVDDFSIEIAIKPETFGMEGFNLILSIHDGKDSDQLILGQYRSYIIAMNGDDYSNRRKIKRISADIFSETPKKLLITITTGHEGTMLYVNGKLIEAESDLILKIPKKDRISITLGNSVYGKNSWRGDVYGLAFYAYRLEPQTIESRYNAWSGNKIFPFSKDEEPLLFFTFNEREGTEIIDCVSGSHKINTPASFHILEKRFISMPLRDFKANKSFFIDFIANLVGFIPLGFIVCALFIQSGGTLQKNAVLFSVTICFLISLCIELAQAWIPSRSSQGLDLMLNTLGAFTGTIIYLKCFIQDSIRTMLR